jgi:N-glycosylase/DNA lyase
MRNVRELRQAHEEKKSEIRKRLKEFEQIRKNKLNDLFVELCFCLCTPMSKAERVIQVINYDNKNLLLKSDKEKIADALKGFARFHNNKARYIVEAREKIRLLENLPNEGLEARDFLIKNFKGLGLKEAAHFLRNIGYKNMAILDRHVINCLYGLKAIRSNSKPGSKKQYDLLAEKFEQFSQKTGIRLDELDLLFWSSRTGKILK